LKCSSVRTFLSQINDREEPIAPFPAADLDFLSANGYVLKTTKEEYDKGVDEVARLSQLIAQVNTESAEEKQADTALQQDERREHSFQFHFGRTKDKEELRQKVQSESAAVSQKESELMSMEANVNGLIQEKSMIDRMVAYDGGYLSLTGLGTVILNDLNVRNYRLADIEFSDFLTEIKATYAELRSITDTASSSAVFLKYRVADLLGLEEDDESSNENDAQGQPPARTPSLIWGIAIGLAKLQGDPDLIKNRFAQALDLLLSFDSTPPNKLMAAEIVTAVRSQDVQSLATVLSNLDKQLRGQNVPKELSVGIAATIMAGRRFDGTYPTDRFTQFKQLTSSFEAASILAVLNVRYNELSSKFQGFRTMFTSWGYTTSEDTEIASAFLAIGELSEDEVGEKLKYIVDQLMNYLQYPLVAAAILASISVFEAHEVLDLMEKAVTLLSAYATGLERSELVTLAVRMIHGVRNELVKELDPTARITETPVQFTYSSRPGFFIWYYPVIIAHSYYHATFSGLGGFHPAHYHGVGGFAG
jgi:hypothetical protein